MFRPVIQSYLPIMIAFAITSCGQNAEPIDSHNSSICGETDDLQHVDSYDGSLAVSKEYVDQAQGPVAVMINKKGMRYCTGTMISSDLFLTAGHCINKNVTNVEKLAFDYQEGKTEVEFTVSEILEAVGEGKGGRLDYAVLRVEGSPGDIYGYATTSSREMKDGETIAIIQHAAGRPKQIDAGLVESSTELRLNYGDIDTLGGSSGAGILDKDGILVGIHTNGGCRAGRGTNNGVRFNAISEASAAIQELLGLVIS